MSTISSVLSPAGSTPAGADSPAASRVPQKVLGQNDFLKLLATQFRAQDPMKPMEDTAFIAQMAQFSALEQSGTMAKELAELRADQRRVTANSYLGHRVTVELEDGTAVTGDVTAVDATGSAPLLVVDGRNFPLSAVLRVEPGVVTAPSLRSAGDA